MRGILKLRTLSTQGHISMDAKFCRQCGASFPPREGEGICVDWHKCLMKQACRNFPTKQVSNSSEPDSSLNSEQSSE